MRSTVVASGSLHGDRDAMLIQSDRHTLKDLELWAEYERADLEADRDRLAKMEASAVECVLSFASAGPCYMSVSGGKDSSALWAIVHLANCGIEAWHLDTKPLADPYVKVVFNELQNRFPMPFHVVENWCRWGLDDNEWHATGTFESGMKEVCRRAKATRYICGVRADESGVRKLSCRYHGKTTRISCRPLAWWSTADVYSYAAIRGIPLHPNYAMFGGGRWHREKLRVAFLTLTHGNQFGRAEWENEYYGDVIRRMKTIVSGEANPRR